MTEPLHVLIVEDDDSDAALVVRHLEQAGFKPAWDRVETEQDFVAALDRHLM